MSAADVIAALARYVRTEYSVPAAVGSTLLSGSNRRIYGRILFNDSAGVVYVKLGAGAAPDSYSAALAPGDSYVVAYRYTGDVSGWCASSTGMIQVTEEKI